MICAGDVARDVDWDLGEGPNSDVFVCVFACSQGCWTYFVAGERLMLMRLRELLKSVFCLWGCC